MALYWVSRITELLILLVAVDLIICGIRAAIISQFKVYLAVGTLYGLLLSIVSFSGLTSDDWSFAPFITFVFCLWPFTRWWMIEQQIKLRAAFPDQWMRWENRVKQAGRIDRLFLYPILSTPPQPITNATGSATGSSKGFRIAMIFMTVACVILLALIILAFLGRRGLLW